MDVSFIPKQLLAFFFADYARQNQMNILISNAIIVFVFLVCKDEVMEWLNTLPHFCLFDKLIGINCPTCGVIRGFFEIANGNLAKAYYLNSSSIFVAIYFVLQIPMRMITLYDNHYIKVVNVTSQVISEILLYSIILAWLVKLIA